MLDINWSEIWGVVITTVVVGIVRYMYSLFKDIKTKNKQEQLTQNNLLHALAKNNEELVSWKKDIDDNNVRLQQKLQSIDQTIQKITHSDIVLMKDRILQTCRCYISKGYITLSARENLTEMYHCYKDMGGNGTGKLLYEQAIQLPVKDIHNFNENIGATPEEEINHVKPSRHKRKHPPSQPEMEN